MNSLQANGPSGLYSSNSTSFGVQQQQQPPPPPHSSRSTASSSNNWNVVAEPATGQINVTLSNHSSASSAHVGPTSGRQLTENMHHHFGAQQQQQPPYPQQLSQGHGLQSSSAAAYHHLNDSYGPPSGRVPPHLMSSGSRGAPQAAVEPNPNLYIHNVPKDATEDELRDLFSVFGTVERIRVKVNQKIGPQALYAFVTFKSTEEAQRALERLNGYEMRTRRLRIEFQRSRGDDDRGLVTPSGASVNGGGNGIPGGTYRDRSTSLGPNRGPRQGAVAAREFASGLRPTERRKRMGFDTAHDGSGGPGGGGGIGAMGGGGGPGPPVTYSVEQHGCEQVSSGPVFKKPRFADDSSYMPEHMNGGSATNTVCFAPNDSTCNDLHYHSGEGSRRQVEDVHSQRQFYGSLNNSDIDTRGASTNLTTTRGGPDFRSSEAAAPSSRYSQTLESTSTSETSAAENRVVVYLCEILRRVKPALFAAMNSDDSTGTARRAPTACGGTPEMSRTNPTIIDEIRHESPASNYYFNFPQHSSQAPSHDGVPIMMATSGPNNANAGSMQRPPSAKQTASSIPVAAQPGGPDQQMMMMSIEDNRGAHGSVSSRPQSLPPSLPVLEAVAYPTGPAPSKDAGGGTEARPFINLGAPPHHEFGTIGPNSLGWPAVAPGPTDLAQPVALSSGAVATGGPAQPPFTVSQQQHRSALAPQQQPSRSPGSPPFDTAPSVATIYSHRSSRIGVIATTPPPTSGNSQDDLDSTTKAADPAETPQRMQPPSVGGPEKQQSALINQACAVARNLEPAVEAAAAAAPEATGTEKALCGRTAPAGTIGETATTTTTGGETVSCVPPVELQSVELVNPAPPQRAVRDPNLPKGATFAEAVLARNSKRRVPIEFTKLDGEFERCVDQLRGSLLNIRHRSSYEDLARKPVVAVCLIQPSYVGLENLQNASERRQERFDCLMGHIQYLDSKHRAGVISTPNSPILYIVGPAAPLFETYTRNLRPPPPQGTVLGLFTTELAKEVSLELRADMVAEERQAMAED